MADSPPAGPRPRRPRGPPPTREHPASPGQPDQPGSFPPPGQCRARRQSPESAPGNGALAAIRDWLARADQLIPAHDRRVLFSLPQLARSFVRWTFLPRAERAPACDVTRRDPALVDLLAELFQAIGRDYFRVRSVGVENVPPTGPFLLVGNHSGGLVTIDSFLAAGAIVHAHGPARAPFALAHDFLFDHPVVRKYAARLGILRANHNSAAAALRAGHPVLVYPGSDWDAFRPYRDRNRVVLAGRKGFLKLALRERVPIVPVLCAGSHQQFVVITRGERLARRLHIHRLARANVFPVVFSLPWGVTSGFLPYLPLPTQVTLGFAPPIDFSHLGPQAADDPAALDHCYSIVEAAMQSQLDHLVQLREGRAPTSI